MSEATTARVLTAAMLMGVGAAWLLGAWLHLRLVRRTRAAARRVVRLVLPMDVAGTLSLLVQNLNRSPLFYTHIRGYVEGVLTASIRTSTTGRPACNMACRMDDLGRECRIRLRLDFTPLIETTRKASKLLVFVLWPLWVALTITWVLGGYMSMLDATPWFVVNLLHAAWPMLIVAVFIHLRFRKRRRLMGDAVVTVVENLKFIPRERGSVPG